LVERTPVVVSTRRQRDRHPTIGAPVDAYVAEHPVDWKP
jgi:hypothetical protein